MSDDEFTYLTTEAVCGKLADAGVDPKTVSKVFAARLKPQNLSDPRQKFAMAVPQGGDPVFPSAVYLVLYRFGPGTVLVKETPLDEDGPDWRPRWVSVEGPFPGRRADEDPKAFAERIGKISKELTA